MIGVSIMIAVDSPVRYVNRFSASQAASGLTYYTQYLLATYPSGMRIPGEPMDLVSFLSLMAAKNERTHLRSGSTVVLPKVNEHHDGAHCFSDSHSDGRIAGINLVHLKSGSTLVVGATDLPTMCGGCSIFIADAAAMLPCDIRGLTKFGGDWGQELVGSTTTEYENGWDEYVTETVIKGPLGQVIVMFSSATRPAVREEALLYLREMLESMVNHETQTADYTEVRWLSKDVVGLFTAYEEGEYTDDDGSGFDNSDLDQVKYPYKDYYGDCACPNTFMKISKKSTASDKCTVFAEAHTRLDGNSLGTKVRTLFNKYSGAYVLPTMLAELVAGKTVILTDNCMGNSGSSSSVVTLNFIDWLLEFGPGLKVLIREYLVGAGVISNTIRADDVGDYIKMERFCVAHNPNESAHEIIGCSIYLDKGAGDVVNQVLDGEVWNYG